MESLERKSNVTLIPTPCRGQTCGHKIADFYILPYNAFIAAFRALECDLECV